MSSTINKTLPLFGPPQDWQTAIYRKRYAFHLLVAEQRYFRRDFMNWLALNWKVWIAFEAEADRTWARGRRHYSARTIGEYLRHETSMREAQNEHGWKVNDHYWPDLGRLYTLMHPDRAKFFERRASPANLRAA